MWQQQKKGTSERTIYTCIAIGTLVQVSVSSVVPHDTGQFGHACCAEPHTRGRAERHGWEGLLGDLPAFRRRGRCLRPPCTLSRTAQR